MVHSQSQCCFVYASLASMQAVTLHSTTKEALGCTAYRCYPCCIFLLSIIMKNTSFLHKLLLQIDLILITLIAYSIFHFTFSEQINVDLIAHLDQIKKINDGEAIYPTNFFYYFFVNLFNDFISLETMATFVLTAAVVGKQWVSKHIIKAINPNLEKNYTTPALFTLYMALFFFFAIPDIYGYFTLKSMYITRFVPLAWHNSTTLFVFPFAILLFWKQWVLLQQEKFLEFKYLLPVYLLIVLNIIIKPSFLFAYLPATGIFILPRLSFKKIKHSLLLLSPLILGAGAIILQSILIYSLELGSFQSANSSIRLSTPFESTRLWNPTWYLPIMFIGSYLLSIVAWLYTPLFRKHPFIRYTLLFIFFAFLIGGFLIEEGPRMKHGNFMWQIHICSYLLATSTIAVLVPSLLSKSKERLSKANLLKVILLLHSMSGMLYIIRYFVTQKLW